MKKVSLFLIVASLLSTSAWAASEADLRTVCQKALSNEIDGTYSDRYGNSEDRKIVQFGNAGVFDIGRMPKYGNNYVVVMSYVVDRSVGGRTIKRDVNNIDCVVSPSLKVLGLEIRR